MADGSTRISNDDMCTSEALVQITPEPRELRRGDQRPTQHVQCANRAVGADARSIARQVQRHVSQFITEGEPNEDGPSRLSVLLFRSRDPGDAECDVGL